MRQDIEALNQLAKIATQGFADEKTLAQAASIIRRATGAAEAMVVYAPDKNFLTCSDAGDGPPTELTLAALTRVQRHAAQTNGPVAFNLIGNRVEDFTSALSDDDRQFLAFTVPTSESAAEMCILRGAWDHKTRPSILRFMQSATPALTIILERLLNANRSQRLGEQLRTLANAAQMLTQSEDVETALRDLATAISASTGFEYLVNIDLYDASTNRFFLRVLSEQRYTGGTLGQIWEAGLNPDRPDAWNVEVMTTLKPVLRPDMQNDPIYPEHVRKFFAQSLLRSTADFPLLFQDEFLGAMAFVSFKPRTFPPDEVSLLQGFVAQAATAVKALQMHKEVQRYAQELKKAADQYIATTNLTGDVICRLDKRGMWTFLNDGACQFFGKPREELLGTNSRAFLHPDEVELTALAIRQMITDKKPVSGFVNRHVTPKGTRVVEWNGYPLFDENGEYTGIQITGRDITERKQLEDALAAKTKEYIDTTNLTGDVIAKVDKHGRYTFLNDAACEFLRRPREELLGTDSRAFVHPDDLEPTAQAIRQTMTSRNLLRGAVSRLVTPLGTRVVEWNGYPLFDADGQYTGTQITGRDITERKQMEDALREAKEFSDGLITSMQDGCSVLDTRGVHVDVNPAFYQMTGFSREELIGVGPPHPYWPPEAYKEIEAAFQKTLRGEFANFELTFMRKNGERFPAIISPSSVKDNQGNVISYFATLKDITERKQMEDALRESEEAFRLLFENAKDAIFHADPGTGLITKCNRAAETLLEKDREEIIGQPQATIHPPQKAEHYIQMFKRHIEQQGFAEDEAEVITKSGKTKPVLITASVASVRGTPIIQGAFRDISERKRLEAERERLHAELEEQAITDGLTGLYNHAHFFQRLDEELERAKRYGRSFSILMMDVDKFKQFNDTRGHPAGDVALRLLADCIRAGLRRSDIAFRYGGDEFAAILLNADSSRAQAIAKRVKRCITRRLQEANDPAAAWLGLSTGVACFPDDATTADDLVKVADAALYDAKRVTHARSAIERAQPAEPLASAKVAVGRKG